MTGSETNVDMQVQREVRDILPRSATIIEAFRRSDSQECSISFVLGIARTLAGLHQQQWNAEDTSRTPGASAENVATSKRRIDELNARRVVLVEQIDTWAAGGIHTQAEEASLHTETLGSVVDRLAIAWVRANNVSRTGDRERACLALRQLAELADAYDDLVRDIGAGQRRLPTWKSLKTYGGEAS